MQILTTFSLIKQLGIFIVLSCCLFVGTAQAIPPQKPELRSLVFNAAGIEHEFYNSSSKENTYNAARDHSLHSGYVFDESIRRADNRQGHIRSRSEVVNQVKQRYNAKVIKISLNKAQAVYRVRILLPNGKIRNINVSAHR